MKVSKMYSAREAGEILSLHPVTVKNWIKEGRIPGVIVGNAWRIPEETIQDIIKNGFSLGPKPTGRPKGGSLQGKPEIMAPYIQEDFVPKPPKVEDCVYPMSPENYERQRAEAKEAKAEREEFNKWQSLSDESRALRAKKEGGKDAEG